MLMIGGSRYLLVKTEDLDKTLTSQVSLKAKVNDSYFETSIARLV